MKTIPKKAVAWAKKIAKDDSHGYNATSGKRLGNPDYACTSFVAGAYRAAGIKVPLNSYSGSVKEKWMPYGFKDVADKVNLRTGEGVQLGDVVVRKGVHSAICINSDTHRLAEAVGSPLSGKPQNGAAGDQTGREIKLRPWYDDRWNICLRYFGTEASVQEIRKKAAKKAKKICRDDRHGYDNRPGYRLGNPDYACSSFVAACYRKAGVPVPANSYTQTMKKQWKEHGFKDVSNSVDFKTGAGLEVGDVLVAPGKHTEIVVSSTHKLAGARGNPHGGATNGRPGDQTGREISVRAYYDDGWTQVLRYKPKESIEIV